MEAVELKPGMEVEAKKPGGRRWRWAKVHDAATEGVHEHVKVKFKGDLHVFALPWKDLKLNHLKPARPTPPPVSASASFADIVDLTSEILSDGDRTSSKEPPGPFEPNGKSRTADKTRDPKFDVAQQRMVWLSGMKLVPSRDSKKPPAVGPAQQGAVGANLLGHLGSHGAGKSSQVSAQAGQPLSRTGFQPFSDTHRIISTPNQSRAPPPPPSPHSQRHPNLAEPPKAPMNPIPYTPTRPHDSLHLRPAPSHGLYPAQATTTPKAGARPFGLERQESVSFPQEKSREGLLEFKRVRFSAWSDLANSPAGARDVEFHEGYNSEPDPNNDRFQSPPKRPRRDASAAAGSLVDGNLRHASKGTGLNPVSVSRHPVHGVNLDIAIPRTVAPSPYRIPRKHDRRDLSESSRRSPYGNSMQSIATTTRGAARRNDIDEYLPQDPFGRYWQNELSSTGASQGPSISRFEPGGSQHGVSFVIKKTRRPPAGPVAESFTRTERFPFNNSDPGEISDMDAQVWEVCANALANFGDEPVDEISRDLGAVAVSQRSSRTGRRRKSIPKRWRNCAFLQVTAGMSVDTKYMKNAAVEESAPEEVSVVRICDCICGSVLGQRRALQCGMCGLWSHLSCVQTYDVVQRNEDKSRTRRFMCIKCSEKLMTEKGILASVFDGEIAPALSGEEPAAFFFAQMPITNSRQCQPVALTECSEALSSSTRSGRRGKVTRMVRPPLTADEINARAANIELLRSGTCGPSAGRREQELIDVRMKRAGPS